MNNFMQCYMISFVFPAEMIMIYFVIMIMYATTQLSLLPLIFIENKRNY